MIDNSERRNFQETVWNYYQQHGRHDLPWRLPDADGSFDPYKIMVSELMLQQTQVSRVILKYQEFLKIFPNIQALATAEQAVVLRAWSGLGYNHRAKFLWQAAQHVSDNYNGEFPQNSEELTKLPGIGKGTAGAIVAYAFNQPAVFIETNIRTVYIHHFFHNSAETVHDKEITAFVEATIDREHPREWYWALMDYGSYLKQTIGNLNHRGRGYTKQSKFEGSLRQIRGQVLRLLGDSSKTLDELAREIQDERLVPVIDALLRESLIRRHDGKLSL